MGSLIGFSLAGIFSDHFQKFLMCSAYVRPYGLPSGGKIFTEVEPATGDDINENDDINKMDIVTRRVIII